jgi:hypothetical protein
VKNATGISCESSRCIYTSCNTGYFDCDGQKRNGCECQCGALNAPCCTSGTPCGSTLYCGADSACHTCKTKNEACTSDVECCNGASYCLASNGTCK